MKPGLWERLAKCDMTVGPHGYWYYALPTDGEFAGLCLEFPSLSWMAPTEEAAIDGVVELVGGVLRDMRERGELLPPKASSDLLTYSVACGCGATESRLTFDQAVSWTNGDGHVCPAQCCVCGSSNGSPKSGRDLRPYGPDGAPICWGCASKPEHEPGAREQYRKALAAAEAADPNGMAALTADGSAPLNTVDVVSAAEVMARRPMVHVATQRTHVVEVTDPDGFSFTLHGVTDAKLAELQADMPTARELAAANQQVLAEVMGQVNELLDAEPASDDVRVVLVRYDYDPEDEQ